MKLHHDGDCHGMGLSAHAIRYGGVDHPHDPGDLNRCLKVASGPPEHMRGRSREWNVLLDHWDEIVDLLDNEKKWRDDGRAPKTFARIQELLSSVRVIAP